MQLDWTTSLYHGLLSHGAHRLLESLELVLGVHVLVALVPAGVEVGLDVGRGRGGVAGEGVDDADEGGGEDAGGAALGLAPVPVAVDDLHDPGRRSFSGVGRFHSRFNGSSHFLPGFLHTNLASRKVSPRYFN